MLTNTPDEIRKENQELRRENAKQRQLLSIVRRTMQEAEELPSTPAQLPFSLHELERIAVLRALEAAHWHRGKAAKLLGCSRSTLFEILKRHGLTGLINGSRRKVHE